VKTVKPCSLVGGFQRFRGTYRLHLQCLSSTTVAIFTAVEAPNIATYSNQTKSNTERAVEWLTLLFSIREFFFFPVPVCAITASGVPGGTFVTMDRFSTLCG
jgi:hypothetical protein